MEPDRDVSKLLEVHREEIAEMREAVKDIAVDAEHDDIFLLRYVLSFGVAEGIKAIRWAIPWRKEPENAYWLNRAEEREEKMQHMNEKREGAINISAYHKVSLCVCTYCVAHSV
jgi:hypothetical protein